MAAREKEEEEHGAVGGGGALRETRMCEQESNKNGKGREKKR